MAGGQYSDAQIFTAVIDETTAASNSIIAAVAGKRLRVLEFCLVVGGATNITLVTLTGAIPLAANQIIYAPYSEAGHWEMVASAAVLMTSSAAVVQGGWVKWAVVAG